MKSSIAKLLSLLMFVWVGAVCCADESAAVGEVTWDSPSRNALGSMPIGNGDIGANVWVEPNGDLLLLLSKTDAWDGNCRLMKLGRVRISLDPPLIEKGTEFRQELDLDSGSIRIKGTTGDREATLRVWIDAHQPVIRVEAASSLASTISVTHETWRDKRRRMSAGEIQGAAYGTRYGPNPAWSEADVVVDGQSDRLVFYYRNAHSLWGETMEVQALTDFAGASDPLMNRTFGAIVSGENLVNAAANKLRSKTAATSHLVSIYPHTAQTSTPEAWIEETAAAAAAADKRPLAEAWAAHESWWRAFWQRSHVRVSASTGAPDEPLGERISLPANNTGWRVGVDSRGTSKFGGVINDPQVLGRALSAEEVAALAAGKPSGKTALVEEKPEKGCTLTAWVKPAAGETGRLLETVAAGSSDGYLFDTHPGLSLRWSADRRTLAVRGCLRANEWQHVAATIDAATGIQRLYLDGKIVADSTRGGELVSNERQAELVSTGYRLQRWVNACGGRGKFPIKFNGTIFTVDNTSYGPDYRAWGGCYWWQNTRLPYWSMAATGDYDLMQPVFKLYLDALPLRKYATKKYFGHDGAHFPETMYFWGTYNNDNYGRDRRGKPDGILDNQFIRREWQAGIELTAMMIDYHAHTQDPAFLRDKLIPFAREIVTFYDQHYKRTDEGVLNIYPAQALETWWDCTNPMPETAGLHAILPQLVKLADSPSDKASWQKLLSELPAIPTGGKGEQRFFTPATRYANRRNMESPELYSVFPYSLHTIGKPDLNVALNTWPRANRKGGGWFQAPIFAARLGLSDAAKNLVATNFSRTESGFRFQAMWTKNFDWTPDQDHGGVSMIALQNMLMQADGEAIRLIPAWPAGWDADFKLHAPKNTTVAAKVQNGKIVDLVVTPESRRKDVVVRQGDSFVAP